MNQPTNDDPIAAMPYCPAATPQEQATLSVVRALIQDASNARKDALQALIDQCSHLTLMPVAEYPYRACELRNLTTLINLDDRLAS